MEKVDIIKGNIKRELRAKNKSIYTLCKELGANRNYISRISAGTPVGKIIDIAHAIGCSPSELLKGME